MADIDSIKLPDNSTYMLKDSTARSSISNILDAIEDIQEQLQFNYYYVGTSAPTSTTGVPGDLYFQLEE